MKLIVDKLPEKPLRCLFAKYCADGMMQCKLTEGGQICLLEFDLECTRLVTASEVNNAEKRNNEDM